MNIRRTTLAADNDDLAVLEAEARRRGISLARMLGELVSREAVELRIRHRPRFGIARSKQGAAGAAAADEKAPIKKRAHS